ncbi:hypothetical protein FO440_02135 [Mucilaginibacter corticis]|uniref:Uncharacterized protein n=1 Tax=Mucilaginibacter corticis TaxID=2597670 RepID=A0A556MT51_9SPHI|nr:contractile injection system tape measure protein [Mucilaginibacter corticis]TSJ43012.1 hypothetical protein FO440_02135 [Mucilaginibacter corticis]
MAKGTHIIHRVVLNIEVSGRGMAKSAENAVKSYFEQVLLKRIEEILDSIDTDSHLLIDKMDLDLGRIILKDDVPIGLEEKLIEAFQSVAIDLEKPGDNADEAAFTRLTEPHKAFKTFVYFLENGRLPWYALSVLQNEDAWLDEIYGILKADLAAKNELLKLISKPVVLGRLFAQFRRSVVKQLVILLLDLAIADIDRVIDQQVKLYVADEAITTAETFAFFEKIVLLIFLRSADRQILALPHLQKQLTYIPYQPQNTIIDDLKIVDALLSTETSKTNISDDKTPDEQQAEADGIFVSQAGLVILHPFLEYFFKDFGLIQNDDFVDIHARQLGVHLLHYLATGQINAFEYDLYFEKFFCCWPANAVIEREVDIPQLMRDEADNMLLAVIRHWRALKNTSPGGLREGFLCRNGKLIESENPVRLIIEKKDMDVLLATLPWGIGVVKLPWMREPFYVEWQ